MKIKPKKLIPVLAVMLLIFIHSAMPADLSGAESGWIVQFAAGILKKLGLPSPDADQLTFVIRKCAHFTEYLILGITVKRLMDDLKTCSVQMRLAAAWVISVLYAATDEIHQHFVPGRSCELRDVCIDAAGAACGIVLAIIWGRLISIWYERMT